MRTITGPLFLRAVARHFDIDPNDATAQKQLRLALNDRDLDQAQINKWWNGRHRPSFDALMLMLDRTGWLTQEARTRLAEVQAEDALELAEAAVQASSQGSPPRKKVTGSGDGP